MDSLSDCCSPGSVSDWSAAECPADRGRGTGRTWYIAASTLTEPERRIGKMLVSALPNGQKTADTIDAANAQLNSIAMLTKQVRDPAVKAEANDFIAATKD